MERELGAVDGIGSHERRRLYRADVDGHQRELRIRPFVEREPDRQDPRGWFADHASVDQLQRHADASGRARITVLSGGAADTCGRH